ncbi:pyridoxal phosphate-dependent aminotransferase [Butyrivibrio sp. AE3004]|uniref:pyridoxal phosphate-dependent aminotransferase n=1 Tax=Butyrivibrio sp. AE3004 TaxID=1506994 RepID=UPI00068AA315|nr:histidinol-phosphate transaminase [Butyrivibrio sp. AE3004]
MSHGGDIYRNKVNIDFSVNLNPLGIQKEVMDAVSGALHNAGNYPDIRQEEVRSKIAKAWGFDKSCAYAGAGASELIMAMVREVTPKKALLYEPGFSGYEYALKAAGCEIEKKLLSEDNGFKLTFQDAESIKEDIDMVFICDPVNPTGANIDEDVLLRILDKVCKTGAYVCLDESFFAMSDKAGKEGLYCHSKLIKKYERLFIVRSMTKLLSMPGIRMGYVVSCPENIKKLIQQLPEWNLSSPGEAGIISGILLAKESDFIDKTMDLISTERRFLEDELRKLGFKVFESDTAFIFFKGPEMLYEALLEKGIMIRDCSDYTGLCKGYYRIAVKSHEDNEKLITAMKNEKTFEEESG